MKYRIKIIEKGTDKWYTPQVLKWPAWLGVWNSINSIGREVNFDVSFLFEYEAVEAINNHKRLQSSTTITYKYID